MRTSPFPSEWRQILSHNFPLFLNLPIEDQHELEGHVQVFLAEKPFEGRGGLVLTDEIKVTIAAQACLLLLHREADYYPGLRSVVVYPSTFSVQETHHSGHGIVTESYAERLGESWQHGAVVLAWDSTLHGAANVADGQNVVLHEFAHQLDQEDGRADGAPILTTRLLRGRAGRYLAWARVLGSEFERLQRDASDGAKTVMDSYGATDPAEFFAVATECFFEKPTLMSRKHPLLYDELKNFYRQDPLQWNSLPRSGNDHSAAS
jgi:Mlc titration factor MtfA (ptsG expression regulator)